MAYSINKEKCTGCDACSAACPTQAISGEQYKKHSIDPEICVSCGLCADFCENEAVYDDNGRLTTFCSWVDWNMPSVDEDKCTGCSLCVDVCPMYALEISKPQFRGDIRTHAFLAEPSVCIGCEKCMKRCPIKAISMIPRV